MGLSNLSSEQLAMWVDASCAAQGVAVKVADPTVVRRVSVLLGAVDEPKRAHPRSGSTHRLAADSEAPDRRDSGGIQFTGSTGSGADHGVVEHGTDDLVLTRQVQRRPGAA